MNDDTTQLVVEALQARIRTAKEIIAESERRIAELTRKPAKQPGKVLQGKWDGRTKEARAAKAKANKPKKRKMSKEARKRISEGIRKHREKKREEEQEQNVVPETPQPVATADEAVKDMHDIVVGMHSND